MRINTMEKIKENQPEFLNTKELAEWLGISAAWININRGSRNAIPFRRLGRRVIYEKSEVLKWWENNEKDQKK